VDHRAADRYGEIEMRYGPDMKRIVMCVAMLIGCGGESAEDQCRAMAERWCCGETGADRDNCIADTMVGACRGCTVSVDFNSCDAALDAAEACADVCEVPEQGCMSPPAACLCE
jgi:hypothetical protein